MTTLHGSCLCGAVRYEVSVPIDSFEYCHCSMCRKAHGSAFSANAVVPSRALVVTAGHEFIAEYQSSPNRLKCFCSRCGSQLFIRRTNRPDLAVICLGTLDSPITVRATRHVFVGDKSLWHTVNDGLPQYEAYPA